MMSAAVAGLRSVRPNRSYTNPRDVTDASVFLSQKACPKCGHETTQLQPKPPVAIQIIEAVRDADLSPGELLDLADAVRAAPDDTSPRQLAEQLPAASKLITVAARAGKEWMSLLILALTIIALYLQESNAQEAHRDAEQAHRDAQRAIEQAHQDAERARRDGRRERREASEAARRTTSLSDKEVEKIVQQIEAGLNRDARP